jgi:ribulose-5-phosphate 4-epimerase/fuculose-1-phosphate aldolase
MLIFSAGLSAHHGGAAYDTTKNVSVTGRVTDFQFINPHVLIYVEVEGEDGEVVEWSGELTSPNRLARSGRGATVQWHREILKPGDVIELGGNPAMNGAPSLRLLKVVDANGVVLIGDGS